jgi:hypothetical protein
LDRASRREGRPSPVLPLGQVVATLSRLLFSCRFFFSHI